MRRAICLWKNYRQSLLKAIVLLVHDAHAPCIGGNWTPRMGCAIFVCYTIVMRAKVDEERNIIQALREEQEFSRACAKQDTAVK